MQFVYGEIVLFLMLFQVEDLVFSYKVPRRYNESFTDPMPVHIKLGVSTLIPNLFISMRCSYENN